MTTAFRNAMMQKCSRINPASDLERRTLKQQRNVIRINNAKLKQH
jgi:hypothetical protein